MARWPPYYPREFFFCLSLQAGVVGSSVVGITLLTVTLLLNAYEENRENWKVNAVQYTLFGVYLAVLYAAFILGFLASFWEKSNLVKIGGFLVVAGILLYVVFVIMSFLPYYNVMKYVCPGLRCPDHHWLTVDRWRRHMIGSDYPYVPKHDYARIDYLPPPTRRMSTPLQPSNSPFFAKPNFLELKEDQIQFLQLLKELEEILEEQNNTTAYETIQDMVENIKVPHNSKLAHIEKYINALDDGKAKDVQNNGTDKASRVTETSLKNDSEIIVRTTLPLPQAPTTKKASPTTSTTTERKHVDRAPEILLIIVSVIYVVMFLVYLVYTALGFFAFSYQLKHDWD